MKLIKCTTSFLIGAYVSFMLMMAISGWIIASEFVSKTSLKTRIVYIDGKAYRVEPK
jgi:hypothetical protein